MALHAAAACHDSARASTPGFTTQEGGKEPISSDDSEQPNSCDWNGENHGEALCANAPAAVVNMDQLGEGHAHGDVGCQGVAPKPQRQANSQELDMATGHTPSAEVTPWLNELEKMDTKQLRCSLEGMLSQGLPQGMVYECPTLRRLPCACPSLDMPKVTNVALEVSSPTLSQAAARSCPMPDANAQDTEATVSIQHDKSVICLLYTSPSPRDRG